MNKPKKVRVREVERIIVKPVYTYVDYSCHYVIRRCGLICKIYPITKPVRGTNRSNTGSVIVGIIGDDGFTKQQKQALAYVLYQVKKQTGRDIKVFAIEDLEKTTPNYLNEDPNNWLE